MDDYWRESDVTEIIEDLSVDQLAALNPEVRALRDEVDDVEGITGDDGSPKYEHGEIYSLDSGAEDDSGEDGGDPDDSQNYESGGVYDLPSE